MGTILLIGEAVLEGWKRQQSGGAGGKESLSAARPSQYLVPPQWAQEQG